MTRAVTPPPKSPTGDIIPSCASFPPIPTEMDVAIPESHDLTRYKCIACADKKRKCQRTRNEYRCKGCTGSLITIVQCLPNISVILPFTKWEDKEYERRLLGFDYVQANADHPASLRHFDSGPELLVSCQVFKSSIANHTRILVKDARGWHFLKTTSYYITQMGSIQQYIQNCIPQAIEEVLRSNTPLKPFFAAAKRLRAHYMIAACLELYTAFRLMRLRLKFSGSEHLGMFEVLDSESPWCNSIPVPRMVQSQVIHILEKYVKDMDSYIQFNKPRKSVREEDLPVTILIYFFLLHVREVDAGRNIYWNRFEDPDGFWQHPWQPWKVLDQTTLSCKQLLSEFYHYVGHPFEKCWSVSTNQQQSQEWMDVMDELSTAVRTLQNTGVMGRSVASAYQPGQPESIALTISSRLFLPIRDSLTFHIV
ncbi:hypothetical protein BDP55DRAFT_53307 [Colletotrichum godetiae]|uniref:Zn(2)-C6 fungal-type domain-containing protein n=1 Tax=Colletotrichum godetiae TaxID=1209918 RepID=A0AAJ0EMW7_9PEZI|nr:uncharacterized protein BDP55DRAFT_53307 [Colletotrichum godetiae]KAK1656972.1 hypothetical protein BDP55DRAFT_53307 [Colletotrichum godetiae]